MVKFEVEEQRVGPLSWLHSCEPDLPAHVHRVLMARNAGTKLAATVFPRTLSLFPHKREDWPPFHKYGTSLDISTNKLAHSRSHRKE